MIRYQKTIRSKELDAYKGFLTKIKSIGNDFLVKGDMWIPCIKTNANSPGSHIGRDPILKEYYEQTENPKYLKFTCSHLAETMADINAVRGRKTIIQITISDDEISILINDTEYVIASKYDEPNTVDWCPEYSYFQDVLSLSDEWFSLSQDTLQALIDGHPVSIKGTISETGEPTIVRLTSRLMKMRGAGRELDHTGEYTLIRVKSNGKTDDTVCEIILHMMYKNIECVNQYYVRKYVVNQKQSIREGS